MKKSLVVKPLAQRLRPKTLESIIGQEVALKKLSTWLEKKYLPSLILWGPPGCGKTTLAPLLAKKIGYPYSSLSAIFSGVAELKKIFKTAQQTYDMTGEPTVLFFDEIHRFNKAQQDAFLPVIEKGSILLIGATTENPSFNLNTALLSRCQVLTLDALTERHLTVLVQQALESSELHYSLEKEAVEYIVQSAQGDARYLLQMLEMLNPSAKATEKPLSVKVIKEIITQRPAAYDKDADLHYNLISALHKSIRSSDVDASLYWLARMLSGGEDPRYILRRLIRISMEDIGLASPQALTISLDTAAAYERLGSPEGDISLTQCVVYLASSPKSNSIEVAHNKALALAKETSHLPPPKNIINAPTKMMKSMAFGKGYIYDPNTVSGVGSQPLWPTRLEQKSLYKPGAWGFESTISDRLKTIKEKRKSSR